LADEEKKKIIRSLFFPAVFVIFMWIMKILDVTFDLDLNRFGLQPLHWKGLAGIITAPFLHADFAHLFANSIPMLVLGGLIFYFYREISWPVVILTWLITGSWVWLFARGNAVHVGASGVVYGMAAFLFLSGIIRREKSSMVITLLVTFLYGGMIWGIFPELFPNQPISWESHLMGLIAGAVLAIWYRKKGPQKKEYDWGEDDDNEDDSDAPWSQPEVHYHPPEK
jgi:membrane associated rhomboid family serine protease